MASLFNEYMTTEETNKIKEHFKKHNKSRNKKENYKVDTKKGNL